ncbi:MAG: mannose-1-phosphate guanylyltransferase/mannose-6-phosphate isomerase [Proteobacteria bacterium]|nr:mannose-1-phosphate guanylyltransferase/mannose-6-phosphate isomerase [Pseudomonadota bacterium]
MLIHPVIMSGGSGTRLWPLSRGDYPKQFLKTGGAHSLLQEAVMRLRGGPAFAKPIVTCAEAHRFIIAEQLRALSVSPQTILLEPVPRSTAAVAALACLWLLQNTKEENPLFLLMPTDHAVGDANAFATACVQAAEAALAGYLVTFGVKPTKPEVGYGYIKPGAATGPAYKAEAFVEKPAAKTAAQYVKDGYLWNSGIFLFPAKQALKELTEYVPDVVSAAKAALDKATRDLDFVRLDKESFEKAPAISVDYALMERTKSAAVVPVNMAWSDVGSFQSLWEMGKKDADGNVIEGDAFVEDTRNSLIRSEGRLAVSLGLENTLLVALDDVVLAAPLSRAQEVKSLVEKLKKQGRAEVAHSRRVYRPWGWFESLCEGPRFQVKRLLVEPGARISLQMHHHRSEHWVVVTGSAKVRRDAEELFVYENQSVYLPAGTKHRLANPGKVPLVVIEVQSGTYLGEDDIVRFEDSYGRQ